MDEFDDQRLKFKTCSTCKRNMSITAFNRNTKNSDGYRSNCRSCARASKAEWHLRNKDLSRSRRKQRRDKVRDFIIERKQAPCLDCGGKFHHSVMDFDHVRGEKVTNIAELRIASASFEKIEIEIDKCDLVCAVCHRIRTWNRANPQEQIPTLSGSSVGRASDC